VKKSKYYVQSTGIMSTAFDEFRRKAQGILPEHADSETTSSIAFHLMQSELEDEKKLEVLKIKMEMEKKLELQEMGMKLQLQKMESANELRQSTAFHSKQLSAVVQRLVVCMSIHIVNLCVLLFFRHLPHHFFASSFLCCVVIQTSC
jgi:hypothetical protein